MGGDPVVPTPVVGELEVTLAGHQSEALAQESPDLVIAIDLPETGNEVRVSGEPVGGHPSPRSGIVRISSTPEGSGTQAGSSSSRPGDASPGGEQGPEARFGR
jgi:hypothetical protein